MSFLRPMSRFTPPHIRLDAELRKTLENALPISIGDDCWIGGNTVICPGVSIGNGCVIEAFGSYKRHLRQFLGGGKSCESD